MGSKKPAVADEMVKWVKTTAPNRAGLLSVIRKNPELEEAIRVVCAMRQRGETTPSKAQLAYKLQEMFPDAGVTVVALRDYIMRHVEGGWGGRVG